MDESEDNMSSEDIKPIDNLSLDKGKSRKRSLIERELETNLTARVTSPVTYCETGNTSRYGRARRLKTETDYDNDKVNKSMKSPIYEKTPVKVQSPVYKMHASNSPIKTEPKETPNKVIIGDSSLDSQIENIYNENISLSRFGSDEKKSKSPGNKFPKVYVRKDLIQKREKEETIMLIKNMFSPVKSGQKSNSHLNNILERSSEKYNLNSSMGISKSHNGFLGNSSVVKTLDFDSNKKKKKENRDGKAVPSKSDLFEMEAKCAFQVGDLAWARMGTYPFWPCIITREPASGMFVKKKLFGRIERDIIHVTFFGDNGRRGWIVDTMLRRFLGQLEFEATKEGFSPSAKKKDPRLYAAFFVSEKKMPLWKISVEEAETLLREPKRLRIDLLYDMLAKSRTVKSITKQQQKSEKITRTASDVSLSESLYDTLFSEDDGKADDTERSRIKTRKSLDVSEVVTACLDNMAAKTGITKIQRQSHMDRWLQKAKSKTPEKLQANLPPPQKDIKVPSSKKKKKTFTVNVPVQKPYSFRKSSYEPRILKSYDNEHDYTNKADESQTSVNDVAGFGIGFVAKVESLANESGNTDADRTVEVMDTTGSEGLKAEDVVPQENANNIKDIGLDTTEEKVDEIQVKICSVEENEELLLGHEEKSVRNKQILEEESAHIEEPDKSTKLAIQCMNEESSPINVDLDKIITEKNTEAVKDTQIDSESIIIEEKSSATTVPDNLNIDINKPVESTNNDSNMKTENQMETVRPGIRVVDPNKLMDIKSPDDHSTPVKSIEVSEDLKNSAEFLKYLELRQDALIDENPELSQEEIVDYLFKTWQYEEGPRLDSTNSSSQKKGHSRSENRKRNRKALSLNSSRSRSKKQQDVLSPKNVFVSPNSVRRSPRTRLSYSPNVSKNGSSLSKDSSTEITFDSTNSEAGCSKSTDAHLHSVERTKNTPNMHENNRLEEENKLTNIRDINNKITGTEVNISPATIEEPKAETAPIMDIINPVDTLKDAKIIAGTSKRNKKVVITEVLKESTDNETQIETFPAQEVLADCKQQTIQDTKEVSEYNIDTPSQMDIDQVDSTFPHSTTENELDIPQNVVKIQKETTRTPDIISCIEAVKTDIVTDIVQDVNNTNKLTETTQKEDEISTHSEKAIENEIKVSSSKKKKPCSIVVPTKKSYSLRFSRANVENPVTHTTCKDDGKSIENLESIQEGSLDLKENTQSIKKVDEISTESKTPIEVTRISTPQRENDVKEPSSQKQTHSLKFPLQRPYSLRGSKVENTIPKIKETTCIENEKNSDFTENELECSVITQKHIETTKNIDDISIISETLIEDLKVSQKEKELSFQKKQTHLLKFPIKRPYALRHSSIDKETIAKIPEASCTENEKSNDLTENDLECSPDTKKHIETTINVDEISTNSETPTEDQKISPSFEEKDIKELSSQKKKTHSLKFTIKRPSSLQDSSMDTQVSKIPEKPCIETEKLVDGTENEQGSSFDINKHTEVIQKEVEVEMSTNSETAIKVTQIKKCIKEVSSKKKKSLLLKFSLRRPCSLRASNVDTEKSNTQIPNTNCIENQKPCEVNEDKQGFTFDTKKDIKSSQRVEENNDNSEPHIAITTIPDKYTAEQPLESTNTEVESREDQEEFFSKLDNCSLSSITEKITEVKPMEIEHDSKIKIHPEETKIPDKINTIIEKVTDSPIEDIQNVKEPNIRIEKSAQVKETPETTTNTPIDIDLDKEYGHLDFLFSSLDKKMMENNVDTNNIREFEYENNEKRFSNDVDCKNNERIEMVDCASKIEIKKDSYITQIDNSNVGIKSNITDSVTESENKEKDISYKCKYKNLFDTCTEFSVRIERLPRNSLPNNIVNIKELDKEITLAESKIVTDDLKTDTSENTVENTNENCKKKDISTNLTDIADTTDNVILNVNDNNDQDKESDDDLIEKLHFDESFEKDTDPVEENLTNTVSTDSEACNSEPDKVFHKESIDNVQNFETQDGTLLNKESNKIYTLPKEQELSKDIIEQNKNVPIEPVEIKTEVTECLQIQPPKGNFYDYILDDDEDEFESPAFSPIFKETPEENECDNQEAKTDNNTDNAVSKTVEEITDTKEKNHEIDSNLIPKSLDEPDRIDMPKSIDIPIKQENEDENDIMTSVSRLPEPIKMNGYHLDEHGLDFSDSDLKAETSSINSEDSEPLAITKKKLLSKNRKNAKKALEDAEFVKYLELRQDAVMDEHPELTQEEIVEYMYKTWQYEENSKSDLRKNDDIEQSGLVKGLNDDLRQKSMRNSFRDKKRNKKRDDDTISLDSSASRRNKKQDDDTMSINSDISDTSIRRRLRTRLSNSPALSLDENEFSVSKESSPERKPEIEDKMSINSDNTIKITKRRVRNQILDDSQDEDTTSVKSESPKNKDKISAKTEENQSKKSPEVGNRTPRSNKKGNIKKYFSVVNSSPETKTKQDDELNNLDVNTKIKEEFDPDTVSLTSINSEDSEVSLSKRKQRKNDKTKAQDDPEFLKYVEMRQDALIDENPQLTQEDIISYLYKTWLYEESVKSDLKKTDDMEQANLVKGLHSEVQPKKVKKKIKVEKEPVVEETVSKEKPKRKTSQPFYYEDIISDIEDEVELFEIFKTKKRIIKAEVDEDGTLIVKSEGNKEIKTELIEVLDEYDEVESYFAQLTQPKPNIFKGLVREKVCDICERTGNLIKCKGCSGMFHSYCEKKEPDEKAVVPLPRGRKKKKKPGRKPKNFEDSGSHSDEKSQDLSEELNGSIEDGDEPRVVDEAELEAVLTAKMKELLPTIDLTYDSYSSDDGLDWNSAPPGHCEIVDVKLKPKTVVDYSDFKCKNCQTYTTPVCFVCKEATSKTGVEHRQKCQTNHCNKYYHLECLDHWPQTQFNSGEPSRNNKKINEHFEAVMCPRHVCHTCVSDDPRGCRTRFSGDKLARCVRCPATYHSFTKCIPAGSQILTGSLIVCPRHYEHKAGKAPCHVNTGWCFICALGGSLICCEYCPTSFHAECLNIKPPEGGYMCEDCETGRLPLYGEMVWVKLGHYRWWPGIILHPSEIPENILAVKHSQGEFVVRFFGQYDHYWVNRGRVFPFQEGDSGRISTQKSKIDAAFITAMEHAHRAFEILKSAEPNDEESLDIASSLLPPAYVKLKVNKPCGSLVGRRTDQEESSLTQCECEPRVPDPCGPHSHCLNRMLLTECGPICRAGDRCNNRAFEKRLYPKMVPYRTPHRGWGLKTLEDIKAGQFVIEYVGELIDEEEFRRRMNRMHEIRDENFYFLTLDKERMIDAGPKGNLARFMNHCCEPNCETQKWTVLGDVRVGLFALYDIPANSELTFNYNLECAGIEKKRCLCGARRCSGYIGAKPKQEESQPKKKRTYKKRVKPVEESPSTSKIKPKRPVGRPAKPRELTEIEKDLLIIKNATNGISSDSERSSSRLSSIDNPNPKTLKRKRISFTEESVSPSTKKVKMEEKSEVGD